MVKTEILSNNLKVLVQKSDSEGEKLANIGIDDLRQTSRVLENQTVSKGIDLSSGGGVMNTSPLVEKREKMLKMIQIYIIYRMLQYEFRCHIVYTIA